MSKTSIMDILSDNNNEIEIKQEIVEYADDFESFFDFENSIENRIKSFVVIYERSKLEAQELVSDLSASYLFSPVDNIYYLIRKLVNVDKVEISIKYLLVTCVYNVIEKRHLSYDLFLSLLDVMYLDKNTFNSTLFFDLIRYLICIDYKDYNKNQNKICEYIKLLCNYSSENTYTNLIYKSLYSLYKEKERYRKDAIIYGITQLLDQSDDKLKIIICTLLYNEPDSILDHKVIINTLKQLANNSDVENIKADVADTLLKFEEQEAKTIGIEILSRLEGIKGKRNFYENSQNVHGIDIDSNLEEFIKFLSSKQSLVVDKLTEDITFDNIKSEILQYSEDDEKVSQSLNRIYLDTNIYKGFNLLTLFIKTYFVIKSHSDREVLKQRLIEELKDMSDTCSTGHLLRLSNIFSGFGYTIKLNVDIEIRSKISHLINLKMSECKEEELEIIIGEMLSQEENNKYKLFFMRNIDWIKQQLLNDYKDVIDKDEFEEIFRRETVFFETGSK